jgi:hypothetical protein
LLAGWQPGSGEKVFSLSLALHSFQLPQVLNSTEDAHVEIMSTFAPMSIFGLFEDVLKERLYQDRQWGPEVDDTLNTPWMWCAYLCGYATKWMKEPTLDARRHQRILRQDDPDKRYRGSCRRECPSPERQSRQDLLRKRVK